MSEKRYNSDIPRPLNTEKERKNAPNTDNQNTQYINIGQNENPENTRVYKPLKRVQNPSNQSNNQNYQRRNVNDYNHQNYPQNSNNGYENTPNYPNNNVYNNTNYYQNNHPQQNNAEYPHYNQGYNNNQNIQHNNNYDDGYSQPRTPQNKKRPSNPQKKSNHNSSEPPKSVKRKKKKKSGGCLKRLIMSLISIFLVFFIIYSIVVLAFIKKMEYVESADRSHYSYALYDSSIKNILVIGTDTRDTSEQGRSDTMILLSLNSKTNQMYLTSIMRDSYVEIEGYGWDKLTHAYSYGGAELLMDTIERNFSVRIDDYVAINFNAFAAVVDAVDGIEIEVSDAEAQEINTILQAEVNELMGDDVNSDLLESGGKLILNGKQALSYSRIRYVGNSDFERTQRQRDVIMKIIDKVKSFNPSAITGIMKSALPQLSTNMSTSELYLLSLRLPFLLTYDLNQQRIPAENTYYSTTTNEGGDALGIDFDANLQLIEDTIFAD